jgi:uncharacterized protein YjbI with pentapeptide repeats
MRLTTALEAKRSVLVGVLAATAIVITATTQVEQPVAAAGLLLAAGVVLFVSAQGNTDLEQRRGQQVVRSVVREAGLALITGAFLVLSLGAVADKAQGTRDKASEEAADDRQRAAEAAAAARQTLAEAATDRRESLAAQLAGELQAEAERGAKNRQDGADDAASARAGRADTEAKRSAAVAQRLENLRFVRQYDANGRVGPFGSLDLEGQSLSGLRLEGSTFSIAKLRNASLVFASLQRANFTGADMRGADLTRANLDGALLCGATLADFSAVNEVRIFGDEARLAGASFVGAKYDRATQWPASGAPLGAMLHETCFSELGSL